MATKQETAELVDHLFRHRAGQITACLTRILGLDNLDLVEDVVQDALIKALKQWPYHGIPKNPSAWIIQVAKNRALDVIRRNKNWQSKEQELQHSIIETQDNDPDMNAAFTNNIDDDQLQMMFACCHPAIPKDAQIALTLKTIGGFSTSEVARAFLSNDKTIAQRIVRAKRKIKEQNIMLEVPPPGELADRLEQVLEAIYLMFNEGYSATQGDTLIREDLCYEAIRLNDLLCRHPATATPKVHAMMALLLFQGSRLAMRADSAGDLILLAEQDRENWDERMLHRGVKHLQAAASGTELSTYHVQAEIAACHALAETYEKTDWRRILDCYDTLLSMHPSPVAALNRVVATLHVHGPEKALTEFEDLELKADFDNYYPAHVVKGEILDKLDRRAEAKACFSQAITFTENVPVKRFLLKRMNKLKS
ncbi:MAG: sigma-70 family RNA polymerase sigma factor [Gammaproteobacteria bacterium]|nr:sigma-70 family RNA polymerase sigma factor [Gammaproteobacteria bacterium]